MDKQRDQLTMGKISFSSIFVDPARCTGCHSCELACSMQHFDLCSPHYSKVEIQEFRDINVFIPIICQCCGTAACMNCCPVNARIRSKNGSIETNEDECIGCKTCISACPFGAVFVNPVTKKPMSCNMCDGEKEGPRCVEACSPHKALSIGTIYDYGYLKRRRWGEKIKDQLFPEFINEDYKDTKKGYSL